MSFFRDFKRKLPIGIRLLKAKTLEVITSLFTDKTVLKNVFRTHYGKTALICTSSPKESRKAHTSKYHNAPTEGKTFAECLSKLGYNVDYTTVANTTIDISKYDVIVPSILLFPKIWKTNCRAITIRYAPGAHPFFCFEVTSKKNIDVHSTKGVWLTSSSRYLTESALGYYANIFADHTIVPGNQYVFSKYLEADSRPERYHRLNGFYFDCHQPDLDAKDFDKTRSHICWFGSLGLIHKGLDIALDIALNHPEITLHICGATKREKEFWNYYNPLIKGHTNIIDHGFLIVDTPEFSEVMSQCAWLINPSISEGMSTAVLNVCANAGLVPIYTKATGVDLQEYGIELIDAQYSLFEAAVLSAIKTDPEELREKSKAVYEHVRQNYTLEQYQKNMLEIMRSIVSSKN